VRARHKRKPTTQRPQSRAVRDCKTFCSAFVGVPDGNPAPTILSPARPPRGTPVLGSRLFDHPDLSKMPMRIIGIGPNVFHARCIPGGQQALVPQRDAVSVEQRMALNISKQKGA